MSTNSACACGHEHTEPQQSADDRQWAPTATEVTEPPVSTDGEVNTEQDASPEAGADEATSAPVPGIKEAELTLTVAPQTAQVFAQAFDLVSKGHAVTIRVAGN